MRAPLVARHMRNETIPQPQLRGCGIDTAVVRAGCPCSIRQAPRPRWPQSNVQVLHTTLISLACVLTAAAVAVTLRP